jgi:hypothetical protein
MVPTLEFLRLKARVEELEREVAALKEKRGPGRPPKSDEAKAA